MKVRTWLEHGAVGGTTRQLYLFGPSRIFCSRGSDTTISQLGAWGERGVGSIGGGGVGEDGVEVGEVVELFLAEMALVVALKL